jgi:hypothetical protein
MKFMSNTLAFFSSLRPQLSEYDESNEQDDNEERRWMSEGRKWTRRWRWRREEETSRQQ